MFLHKKNLFSQKLHPAFFNSRNKKYSCSGLHIFTVTKLEKNQLTASSCLQFKLNFLFYIPRAYLVECQTFQISCLDSYPFLPLKNKCIFHLNHPPLLQLPLDWSGNLLSWVSLCSEKTSGCLVYQIFIYSF